MLFRLTPRSVIVRTTHAWQRITWLCHCPFFVVLWLCCDVWHWIAMLIWVLFCIIHFHIKEIESCCVLGGGARPHPVTTPKKTLHFQQTAPTADHLTVEHLTVESYTVFICQQSSLRYLIFHNPLTLSLQALKPSFSANPSQCSSSFLLLKCSLHGFPGLFTVISEHMFSTFSFSVFTLFSCRFRAVD